MVVKTFGKYFRVLGLTSLLICIWFVSRRDWYGARFGFHTFRQRRPAAGAAPCLKHSVPDSNVTCGYIREWGGSGGGDRLLTLFTTLKDVNVRQNIHNRTLQNWISLGRAVVPVLFLSPSDHVHWSVDATRLGWSIDMVPKARGGVPVLKHMFALASKKYPAQYIGYANADDLFGCSLLETLAALSSRYDKLIHGNVSLIIGRRRDAKEALLADIPAADYVDRVAPLHELHPPSGIDYFIISNTAGFYWEKMPDFVVGRIGYDNWLVAKALEWNVVVVDATTTITALHQGAKDGFRSGHRISNETSKSLNTRLLGKVNLRRGFVHRASWRTNKTMLSPEGNLETTIKLERVNFADNSLSKSGNMMKSKNNQ